MTASISHADRYALLRSTAKEQFLECLDRATDPQIMSPKEAINFLYELHDDIAARIEALK